MTLARRSASSGNSPPALNLVTQKSAKKKAKKSANRAGEKSVLGSLGSTRPTRIGGERRGLRATDDDRGHGNHGLEARGG